MRPRVKAEMKVSDSIIMTRSNEDANRHGPIEIHRGAAELWRTAALYSVSSEMRVV